eukprot:1186567-Prorocentrum_minimum.AAC.7
MAPAIKIGAMIGPNTFACAGSNATPPAKQQGPHLSRLNSPTRTLNSPPWTLKAPLALSDFLDASTSLGPARRISVLDFSTRYDLDLLTLSLFYTLISSAIGAALGRGGRRKNSTTVVLFFPFWCFLGGGRTDDAEQHVEGDGDCGEGAERLHVALAAARHVRHVHVVPTEGHAHQQRPEDAPEALRHRVQYVPASDHHTISHHQSISHHQ